MVQSVVSAEANERMAWDAARVAAASERRVANEMAAQANMNNWEAWQDRMASAKRVADAAASKAVDAAKAACAARWANAQVSM